MILDQRGAGGYTRMEKDHMSKRPVISLCRLLPSLWEPVHPLNRPQALMQGTIGKVTKMPRYELEGPFKGCGVITNALHRLQAPWYGAGQLTGCKARSWTSCACIEVEGLEAD